MNEDKLNFSVQVLKKTGKVIIKEGNIISIEIRKDWQKPDADIRNRALWVYHVASNSTGIELVKFYSSELVIKKHGIIYHGRFSLNYSNEEEEYYSCELVREESEGTSWLTVFLILVIIVAVVAIFASKTRII